MKISDSAFLQLHFWDKSWISIHSVIPRTPYVLFLADGKIARNWLLQMQCFKLGNFMKGTSQRPECDCHRRRCRHLPSLARMFAVDVISQNGLRRRRKGPPKKWRQRRQERPDDIMGNRHILFPHCGKCSSMQISCDISHGHRNYSFCINHNNLMWNFYLILRLEMC